MTLAPGATWRQAEPLARFRKRIPQFSLPEREQIVDAAIAMLSGYYVHLPQKQASHGVDPVARLRALRRRLPGMDGGAAFHTALADVFDSLMDLHTNYLLPAALADAVAFLPFQLGECVAAGERQVIVTHVAEGFDEAAPGDEVVSWTGIPILRALERVAGRTAGANPSAARAQALAAMTMRPLLKRPPPDEDWAALELRTGDAESRHLRADWHVLELPKRHGRRGASLDMQVDALRRARRELFPPAAGPANWLEVPTAMPRNFAAAALRDGHADLGYIRVHTFLADNADAFVTEFASLLARVPPRGLILDVRDNGGGLVDAAERCLQLLTPHPVTPAPMQWRATPPVLALCQRQGQSNPDRVADLSPWAASVQHALDIGSPFSTTAPITTPEACNTLGQQYHGPVVLLTSALSYSATDIFAGGFQDHGIGLVLGVHAATGAGGANVWPHAVLQQALGGPRALPQGAELRVAVRRSLRVGPNAGLELEERGVVPDELHDLTRRDLLEGDADLMAAAARLLLARPWRQLDAKVLPGHGLQVRLRHADRLDVWRNNRPLLSQDVAAGPHGACVSLTVAGPARVQLRAYAEDELVACRVVELL